MMTFMRAMTLNESNPEYAAQSWRDGSVDIPISEEARLEVERLGKEEANRRGLGAIFREDYRDAFARYIAKVDRLARTADEVAVVNGFEPKSSLRIPLLDLILACPEDEILLEARQLAAMASSKSPTIQKQIAEGGYDKGDYVQLALAALRRGVDLGRGKVDG